MTNGLLIDPLLRLAVTPQLERAVWKMCTSVPGLIPEGIDVTPGSEAQPESIAYTLRGWSPTLHACTIQFAGVRGPAATSLEHAALDLLASMVAEQKLRADEALDHGIGMPVGTSRSTRIDRHLHGDASHLAMAIQEGVTKALQGDQWSDGDYDGDPMDNPQIVDDVLRRANDTVSLSHSGDARPYDGGSVIASSGCVGMQRTDKSGRTIRCVGMASCSMPVGDGRLLIGNSASGATRITIPRNGMPETVLGALSGHRFDEVFELPVFLKKYLAPRILGDSEDRNNTVHITLRPLDASFADLADSTPSAALARLLTLIREHRP